MAPASHRTSTLSNSSENKYMGTYMPGDENGSTNVFGDEFAADYAESIRTPDAGAENPFLDTATSDDNPSRRGSIETIRSAIPPHVYQGNARSSTRKSVNLGDAGASNRSGRETGRRHDENLSPEARGLMGSGRSHRSSSASSNFSFAPSRSSAGQPSGPSHPYNMYPQDLGVSRSDSVASTSTGRPARGQSRRGPQHPYTMYPQNVVGSSLAPSVAAPPSASDRDSIRPSEYSEQLPAYTRYPDEMHTKIAAGPPLTPTSQRSFPREVQERSSLGRSPFEGSPFEPYTYGVATGVPAAHYTAPQIEQPLSFQGREKEEAPAQKYAWLRRKACGVIPMWIIYLTIAVVVLIAAICGGVIGAFLSHHPRRVFRHLPPPNSTSSTSPAIAASEYTLDPTSTIPVTVTSTPYLDASPIVTPTSSILALPTGTYQLSVDRPASSSNSSSCLTDADQRVAWSCHLNVLESWSVQIQTTGAGNFVSINGTIPPMVLSYGTQPPILTDMPFQLVTDLDHPSLGPAYHFQTFYNKLVVLPAGALTPSTTTNKRSLNTFHLEAKAIAFNDQPWFCWFNETLIEGFVYVNHADDGPNTPSSTTVYTDPSTPIGTTSVTAVTTVIAQLSPAESASTPFFSSEWGPYSHPTGYNPPNGWPPRPTSSCATTPGYNPWSETLPVRRQASSSSPSTPTYLPKLFRVEERRAARVGPAACTQMAQVSPFLYAPVISNGQEVVIELAETDPAAEYVQWQTTTTTVTSTAPVQKRDQADAGACYCVWES